jgi:hypothetical protein
VCVAKIQIFKSGKDGETIFIYKAWGKTLFVAFGISSIAPSPFNLGSVGAQNIIMKTVLEHYKELKLEVKRLSDLLETNGIDPTTGKAVSKVSAPINVSLKDGKAVIKRIQ